MSRSAAAASNDPLGLGAGNKQISGYLERSERPLYSLAFLLPLIALYEIGSRLVRSEPIAFHLLRIFYRWFGVSGRFLPAITVVAVLLTWHIARRDRWTLQVGTLIAMAMESLLLSLPLLALGFACARWQSSVPLGAMGIAPRLSGAGSVWTDHAVLSIGAGIYEELVFRLMGLTALHTLLVGFLKMPETRANLLMVFSSAVLFSLYHYLGDEPFAWWTFWFRTAAGIYFGGIFMCRGFGVTAGSHASYDVILTFFQLAR
jgi:Type II CAAX prenyl endopeptidase Rce1-like